MKRSTLSVVAGLVAVLVASPAFAQANAQSRQGFWFNGGLGYGSLGCDGCGSRTGGISGGLSAGMTISPRFLLGIGTTGWTKSDQGATLTVGTLDARVRFYPALTNGFYVTGGLGLGSMSATVSGVGSGSELGLGFVLGLGYDIRVGNNVSLTPFWHGYAVSIDGGSANVGQLGLSVTVH
jgi:hypothetical protein